MEGLEARQSQQGQQTSQSSGTPSTSTSRHRGRHSRGGRHSGSDGRHNSRGGRGGRGGRGQSQGQGQHGQRLADRNEAPPIDPATAVSLASPAAPSPDSRRRGGGRRRAPGAGSRRGGNENVQRSTLGGSRSFGGHLTNGSETDGSASPSLTHLSPNAPEFRPGQPVIGLSTSAVTPERARNHHSHQASKSTAHDLATRIHEDISNGQYECVICTNEVLRNSKVWSCSICWTVTHIACVKKWFSSRKRNSDEEQIDWRCPGCNSHLSDDPGTYHCWCGKEINPKSIPGLVAHSCGQTCSKPRATCPHPCPLECHAGPCPPCQLMGPSQSCFCGKHTSTKRCGETDYTRGWSCHEICGDLLPCGKHECQKECHSGLCGGCDIPTLSLCYCGQNSKEIPCDQRDDERESYNYGQVDLVGGILDDGELPRNWYWASFDCDNVCGRSFDCGKHHCRRSCHPQDEKEAHCPFSPDLITHCPCGKTPLIDIIDQPRESCEAPIPSCGKRCNKPFPCGHLCPDECHTGPCTPCTQIMEISCKCGRTMVKSICHQGRVELPECMRICRAQLNCGRHEHGERCCSGEKKALERAAVAKRKNRNAGLANNEIEAEHICTRVCGRSLKCGRHQCQQMCHKGPCPSCPEAIFEEISCNCGRTVLQPPQPCGTRPPECRFECTRPRACGHPQVSHNCHLDGETCPKCPFLVEKRCICGKKVLKNQPCWFEEPRCGLPCGLKLKCGTHLCRKSCHRPGECEDVGIAGSRCKQPCGKKRGCGHLDLEPCHAPYPCKEDSPCQAKTFITCDCQRRKQEVRCMVTKKNPSPQREALRCDVECLRLLRNARLAEALNIDPQSHIDNHVPYSDRTLKMYREDTQFAQTYEREYRVFAADPTQKTLRFKPMKNHQRVFLHLLAEDFGLDSESADPEPHRHVCLFKTPRFVSAPMKTIGQCLQTQTNTAVQQVHQPLVPTGKENAVQQPYNALLLTAPRFGLTIEDLNSQLEQEYATHPDVIFHTAFLPSDEVIIKGSSPWGTQDLESSLIALKPKISHKLIQSGCVRGVALCHVDDELKILRNEKDAQAGGEGWSSVIRRSSARPKLAATMASEESSSSTSLRSNFVVLKKEPKKKLEKLPVEDVEEDWEAAAEKLNEE
ncbi:hypothetical protein F5Y04DRAFT_258111 [Hypomontagnella monticulosa]|nr:hypothetical protein F5Y04DRAFT_258111 [Hypomontagnella monticulosa]